MHPLVRVDAKLAETFRGEANFGPDCVVGSAVLRGYANAIFAVCKCGYHGTVINDVDFYAVRAHSARVCRPGYFKIVGIYGEALERDLRGRNFFCKGVASVERDFKLSERNFV